MKLWVKKGDFDRSIVSLNVKIDMAVYPSEKSWLRFLKLKTKILDAGNFIKKVN